MESNHGEIIGYVYRTNDLEQFITLEGNREVEIPRKKKIAESIRKNGYIHCPIIVNEKNEVIDGQGRLEALKQFNLPAEYIVFEGMTIKDCIALNICQTGWSILDYIESYAERGYRSYEFLLRLIKQYKDIPIQVCMNAVSGTYGRSGWPMRPLKAGDFKCTGDDYEQADELLGYVMRFLKTIKNFKKGPFPYIAAAIMFAYKVPDVDRNKLVENFERYYGMDDIPQFIDTDGALKILTAIYNRRNRKEKIYFEIEYDKYMNGKFGWYEKKWGNKKPKGEAE